MAPATNTTPIHNRPNPVDSAISSPYRESLVPTRTITAALHTKVNQIIDSP